MGHGSTSQEPVHRLVIYRPKAGKLADLEAIVKRHGGVLRKAGLLADQPVQVFRGTDLRKPEAGTFLVEVFWWKDGSSSEVAHQLPEVMAVWETMGPIMESMQLTTLEAIA